MPIAVWPVAQHIRGNHPRPSPEPHPFSALPLTSHRSADPAPASRIERCPMRKLVCRKSGADTTAIATPLNDDRKRGPTPSVDRHVLNNLEHPERALAGRSKWILRAPHGHTLGQPTSISAISQMTIPDQRTNGRAAGGRGRHPWPCLCYRSTRPPYPGSPGYTSPSGTWMARHLVVGDAPHRVIGRPDDHIRGHPDNHILAALEGRSRPTMTQDWATQAPRRRGRQSFPVKLSLRLFNVPATYADTGKPSLMLPPVLP